jgi:hypothetical protein
MATAVQHRSQRQRHSDPADQQAQLSAAELEFMGAMEAYKQRSGRLFPTWSEVFEVLRSLGYRRPDPPDQCPRHHG